MEVFIPQERFNGLALNARVSFLINEREVDFVIPENASKTNILTKQFMIGKKNEKTSCYQIFELSFIYLARWL